MLFRSHVPAHGHGLHLVGETRERPGDEQAAEVRPPEGGVRVVSGTGPGAVAAQAPSPDGAAGPERVPVGLAGTVQLAVADVGVFAAAAGLAVLAVGEEIEIAVLAGGAIDVRMTPGIRRHVLLQIGSGPLDRKSTRLNSSHSQQSRMPSSA